MSDTPKKDTRTVNDAIIQDIAAAVAGLDFGTVTIKVHGSKVQQMEVTRKKRFEDARYIEEGGGI